QKRRYSRVHRARDGEFAVGDRTHAALDLQRLSLESDGRHVGLAAEIEGDTAADARRDHLRDGARVAYRRDRDVVELLPYNLRHDGHDVLGTARAAVVA